MSCTMPAHRRRQMAHDCDEIIGSSGLTFIADLVIKASVSLFDIVSNNPGLAESGVQKPELGDFRDFLSAAASAVAAFACNAIEEPPAAGAAGPRPHLLVWRTALGTVLWTISNGVWRLRPQPPEALQLESKRP